MFLVKRKESRDFDLFFFFFYSVYGCFFGCLEERKYVERNWADKIFQKKCVSPRSDGCLGLFVAPGAFFEVVAIVGPLVAIQWPSASNHL